MIEPINGEQRKAVLDQTESFIVQAEQIYDRKFKRIPVVFDLRGSTAGMYKVYGKRRWIRFNPWIFGKYFDLSLKDTVPHEVAHYIVDEFYGKGVKPHGIQWKNLMARFEADPGVTFNLDISDIPQRAQNTHQYQCLCDTHEMSTTRHNRVMRGKGSYQCRNCDGELVYVE